MLADFVWVWLLFFPNQSVMTDGSVSSMSFLIDTEDAIALATINLMFVT